MKEIINSTELSTPELRTHSNIRDADIEKTLVISVLGVRAKLFDTAFQQERVVHSHCSSGLFALCPFHIPGTIRLVKNAILKKSIKKSLLSSKKWTNMHEELK
jgi:hypothetical protein